MTKRMCEPYPLVNGEISTMYRQLLKITKNRPLTNLIYAAYLQQGVTAQMDSQGFTTINEQGQHSANDVATFFDLPTMKREAVDTFNIGVTFGATDNVGNLVDFSDSEQALNVANGINTAKKGVTAQVVQKGDVFNVIVNPRTATTQIRSNDVRTQLQVWNVIKQAFNSVGIDITSPDIDKTLINAVNGASAINWLSNLQRTDNHIIPQKEIKFLLQLSINTSPVQRLIQMFGTLDDVASKIYTAYRVAGTATSSQMMLINNALNISKQVAGLDVNSLLQQISGIKNSMSTTQEATIQQTLDQLNKDFNINKDEVQLINNNITSLRDAASEAAITLKRQLKQLQAKEGHTQRVKDLGTAIQNMLTSIANNKHYTGILTFLKEATAQINNLEQDLLNIPNSGNTLQDTAEIAKVLNQVNVLHSGYYHILDALSDMDTLNTDEALSANDKSNIKNQATLLRDFFTKYRRKIKALRENTMIDLTTEYIGNSLSNGLAAVDLVMMAEADSSSYDKLYSIARVSNPLISTMGAIIRDAQDARDKKMNDISKRIREAEYKLRKAGHNSRFMYEDNDYIISDIDWEKYYKAKYKYRNTLYRRGLRGLALEDAMQDWIDSNTEDRVVDLNNMRTEKVPNTSYRKTFPNLTQAQAEYYNTMMQLKGELGSLLPDYAQRQYVPPQVRRSFIDALVDATRNHTSVKDFVKTLVKGTAKAIKNKVQDIWTIRENDEDFSRNGLISGENFTITDGELDNTPARQIPIFFVNKLEDSDELLRNFSTGLQHLAGTAINFEAMNKIQNTVEFMADFIKNQDLAATRAGNKQADLVENQAIRIFKNLISYSKNSNTSAIIDGFLDKHLYGVKIKNPSKVTKVLKSLLAYNSIRSLAVNLKGIISNYLVGEIQMLIESGAGEFYNPIDYIRANAIVFGDNTMKAPGRIMDFLTDNVNSKPVLLAQLFDPLQENFEEQAHKKYYRGPLRHLLGHDFTFMGYGVGEHMIHYVNMYACLLNKKVRINGEEYKHKGVRYTLNDAFEVSNKRNGNSELVLKNGVEYRDENGNWVPLTSLEDPFIEQMRRNIREVNQNTHGSMNEEDKGLIHQHMLGRYVMNLRQWMIEHYSRRYRSRYWNANMREEREGYYNTVGRLMLGLASDYLRFEREGALHWNEMNKHQRANFKRACSEIAVWASLLGLQFALGEPQDHKKEFWYRMWIYQTKRSIVDVQGSIPIGIPTEANTLINSPIAATNTINALMYPVTGLGDVNKKIKSGKHKGEYVYLRNFYKYWIPFTKQIEQIQEFDEDESLFQIFEKNNL